jgi:hypothetical protein
MFPMNGDDRRPSMRRNLMLAVGAASALAISGAANAAVTIDDTSITDIDGPESMNGTTTIGFNEAGLDTPDFSEYLTFTNTIAGLYSFTVSSSSRNVDFTNVVLTGAGGPYNFSEGFNNGITEFWEYSELALGAGQYTLQIDGDNAGNGALSGSITIEQAVPEPATWAMMLFGFGAIGFAMRRRKDTQSPKRVRLSYS